jgi:hypothetical protein
MKHRFQPGSTPWNRGKKGLEAGWTPARRRKASRRQKKWMRENRHLIQYNYNYVVGPDPEVRRHYYRWLRAQAQARFWRQEWSILWEDYLDIFRTAPGRWGGRDGDALHLARIDTDEGWHLWNVHLVNRGQSMRRSTRGKKRIRPAGLHSNSVQDPNTGKWSRRK